MNKRNFIAIFMILVFLGSAITVIAVNPFRAGAINIDNFINGGWRGYEEVILFVLLFILFTAAFVLALTKTFGEANRQVKVIAVVIALMSALSIVATTDFNLDQMSYIALGLGFLILVLLIQGILMKMGIQSKPVAFILALLIALLLTFLLAKLLSDRQGIGVSGIGKPSWWHDLNLLKLKRGLKLEFVEIGQVKTERGIPEQVAVPPKEEPPKEEPPKEEPTDWPSPLWLLLLLLIPLLFGLNKLRKRERKPKEPKWEVPGIEGVIELKKEVLKKIIWIVKEKEKEEGDLLKTYNEIINKKGFDPVFYRDKDSDEFAELMKEAGDAGELLKLERELEEELRKLMKAENYLKGDLLDETKELLKKGKQLQGGLFEEVGLLRKWRNKINNEHPIDKATPEQRDALNKINKVFDILMGEGFSTSGPGYGLVDEITKLIADYFLIGKDESEALFLILRLIKHKELNRWFDKNKYGKWKDLRRKGIEDLKESFGKEKELLVGEIDPKLGKVRGKNSLYYKLYKQAGYMLAIIRLLEYLKSERKAHTELEPLKVAPEEAANPNVGLVKGLPLKVYTKVNQGIAPFEVILYIDGKQIAGKKVRAVDESIEFASEVNALRDLEVGEHEIRITAISEKDRSEDVKSITLNIVKGIISTEGLDAGSIKESMEEVVGVPGGGRVAEKPARTGADVFGEALDDKGLAAGVPDRSKAAEGAAPAAEEEFPEELEGVNLPQELSLGEKIEVEKKVAEIDEWVKRGKEKAEIAKKQGRMSDYKKEFLKILGVLEKEARNVKQRLRKSKRARRMREEVKTLLQELNRNIKNARKTLRYEDLNAAKSIIYDLISISSDSQVQVGKKKGKRKKGKYNRAKVKSDARREDSGREPIEEAPDENVEDWEEYKRKQAEQKKPESGTWDALKGLK